MTSSCVYLNTSSATETISSTYFTCHRRIEPLHQGFPRHSTLSKASSSYLLHHQPFVSCLLLREFSIFIPFSNALTFPSRLIFHKNTFHLHTYIVHQDSILSTIVVISSLMLSRCAQGGTVSSTVLPFKLSITKMMMECDLRGSSDFH